VSEKLEEPLNPSAAKKLILKMLSDGTYFLSFPHCEEEMAKDKLIIGDVINVLRGGVVEPAELIKGSWRYRVRTTKIFAVVSFVSSDSMCVVTAWRKKEKK
jgi:hypothetical protein